MQWKSHSLALALTLLPATGWAQMQTPYVLLPPSEATAFIGHRLGLAQIPVTGGWQPTQSDVDSIEANLDRIAFLARTYFPDRPVEHPSTYFRQYLGILDGKRRLIYVNAFCGAVKTGQPPANWHDRLFNVSDGGNCFWQATYDLTSRSFIDLAVNGLA